MKHCPKCEVEKPLDSFHKNRRMADGLEPSCKECTNKRLREAYAKNPGPKIAATRQYHLDHPEWSRDRLRAHHVANAKERNQRVQDRIQSDPLFASYRREQTRRSEQRRRAYKAGSQVTPVTSKDFTRILGEHQGCCWICKQDLSQEVLCWDHVRPLAKGGPHSAENLRPACGRCNAIKSARWPMTEKLLNEIRTQSLASLEMAGGDAQ